MSHEDFNQELNALRENLPKVVEETAPSKTANQYYSIDKANEICDYVYQGRSLLWISENVSEMPAYNTLIRWKRENAEFSKMLQATRKARAEHFEEMAIEAAESAEDPKEVPAVRLRFDAYKWRAEVNDPDTYGKKVSHSGSIEAKTTFNVVTGFGPPNQWQTPPKLKPDGTIDKSYETAKEVQSEVSSGSGNSQGRGQDERTHPEGNERGPESAGPQHTESSDEHSRSSGVSALPTVEGHSPDDGSPESA